MTLVKFHPAHDLMRMRQMDRLFNNFFSRSFSDDDYPEIDWSPSVDIMEKESEYFLRAELPGLNKDDVKITLQDNVLTLKGEKKEEVKEENKNYHLCERKHGKFLRSFRIPTPVETKKIDASYNDGILTISLPKTEEAKPKEIEISMN